MQKQVNKLYGGLTAASVAARQHKASLRMLLDVESFQSYLTHAVHHFSGTLDYPFDFVQASFANSPIPENFGGNILKLAINIMNVWDKKAWPRIIFEALGFMVASCIMFESVRNKVPGKFSDPLFIKSRLISLGKVEQIFPKYLEHIDAALGNFLDQHWPCEFSIEGAQGPCVNVRNGHGSKGHQLKNGNIFAAGDYESEISFEGYMETFRNNVYQCLRRLLETLRQQLQAHDMMSGAADEESSLAIGGDMEATNIHRDSLQRFYKDIADRGNISERFSSHTVCYSCLLEPPEHTLPCGHILCTPCVSMFGGSQDPLEIEIRECPLEGKTRHGHWPWKFHTKPKSAGVRILTLDGYGTR
jgi:hypothetical protein